jgi:uncharacterized protein YecT (DUF1311 family)
MKTILLLFILVLSQVFSGAVAANDWECNPAGNQSQMNACAEEDFSKSDRELNVVYKRVIANLDRTGQQELRQEQRKWLKERDPQCKAKADSEAEGGSMWPMEYQSCRAKITRERTKILMKRFAK